MSIPPFGPSKMPWPIARSVRTLLIMSCLQSPIVFGKQEAQIFFDSPLTQSLWGDVADRYGLDPYLLYAVALVESSRIENGEAAPWPWAIHHRGRAIYPGSRAEALSYLRRQILAGEQTLDVGLMQVNFKWHGHRVASLESLMEPKTNLDLGARILAESLASAPSDRTLGIGRYHAWQDREEALRYGRKVLHVADALKTLHPFNLLEKP